ncbi:MAG TPA: hypothetical protein VIJ29_04795 [Candidatus Paceibacterota bacterium]
MRILGTIAMALGLLVAVVGLIVALCSGLQDPQSYVWVTDNSQVSIGMGALLTGCLMVIGGTALFNKPVRSSR